MPSTRSAPRRRGGRICRLAAACAGAIALTAGAQTYRIPDLRPPPPRVAPAPPAGEPCNSCARIVAIREVNLVQRLPAAGVGPVPGGEPGSLKEQNLIGAVISLPLGAKSADRPYVGPAGTPEMYARMRETTYEITLQMDDGTYRSVRRADATAFGVGDRVRWLGGSELELLVRS